MNEMDHALDALMNTVGEPDGRDKHVVSSPAHHKRNRPHFSDVQVI